MIKINNKTQCCGCSSCVQRCPKQCISLHEDSEGFLYPKVDETTCIDCGLCEKVCPVLNPYDTKAPIKVFAAINNNEKIRLDSSSGGIFSILAENTIIDGGIVFGARYDENWQVTLDYTETIEGLAAFRGSKYVQARTGESFSQCEKFLREGRKVLFTGTPCQIAGLHHFLRKQYENLTTCDFVCHGVPSPKVWRMYLKEVVKETNRAITDIKFRNKDNGWKLFNFKMHYDENHKVMTLSSYHRDNIYMRAFLSDLILRPSCYSCSAKEGKSMSDITIADFWGIDKSHPDFDDDLGTGLILLHTDKGEKALDWASMRAIETKYEDAIPFNKGLNAHTPIHRNRAKFFAMLDATNNLSQLIIDCTKPTYKQQLRRIVTLPFRLIRRVCRLIMGGVKIVMKTNVSNPSIRKCRKNLSQLKM